MDIDLNYFLTPERVTLVRLLEKADIPVYVDGAMCEGEYYGYTTTDSSIESIMVIICLNTLSDYYKSYDILSRGINRTVDHEALHAAQHCKNEYYPGSVSDDWTTDAELEAISYEGRPQAVGEKIIQFCF